MRLGMSREKSWKPTSSSSSPLYNPSTPAFSPSPHLDTFFLKLSSILCGVRHQVLAGLVLELGNFHQGGTCWRTIWVNPSYLNMPRGASWDSMQSCPGHDRRLQSCPLCFKYLCAECSRALRCYGIVSVFVTYHSGRPVLPYCLEGLAEHLAAVLSNDRMPRPSSPLFNPPRGVSPNCFCGRRLGSDGLRW